VERAQGADRQLADETDADLLVYMSMAADDPAAAREAWSVFYRRHVEYLYAVCLRAYGPLVGGAAGVGDVVADAFRRAYEHAGTFSVGEVDDDERLRLRVRGWLGRIAQRLVQSMLRSRGKCPSRFLPPEQWSNVAQRPAAAADGERVQAVRDALETLNEKEQIVLRTTFQWYQIGREHQRLPNDVVADLAETLQTTPENLRQIRWRAMKKVESILRGGGVAEASGE
jgi:RNA polymerase sigma factor (sigma-70 family)